MREEGYYWVKHSVDTWVIARWQYFSPPNPENFGYWCLFDDDECYKDEEFYHIGSKIEQPTEKGV